MCCVFFFLLTAAHIFLCVCPSQEIWDWVLCHAGQDWCPPLQWKQHWARHSLRQILQGVHIGNYWPWWVPAFVKTSIIHMRFIQKAFHYCHKHQACFWLVHESGPILKTFCNDRILMWSCHVLYKEQYSNGLMGCFKYMFVLGPV